MRPHLAKLVLLFLHRSRCREIHTHFFNLGRGGCRVDKIPFFWYILNLTSIVRREWRLAFLSRGHYDPPKVSIVSLCDLKIDELFFLRAGENVPGRECPAACGAGENVHFLSRGHSLPLLKKSSSIFKSQREISTKEQLSHHLLAHIGEKPHLCHKICNKIPIYNRKIAKKHILKKENNIRHRRKWLFQPSVNSRKYFPSGWRPRGSKNLELTSGWKVLLSYLWR